MKRGGGPKYKPEMCQTVVDMMAEGCSVLEVAAELGVIDRTLRNWANPEYSRYEPDMADALERGFVLAQAWWERQGRTNLKNKDFNFVGWYMNMKNRFGWRDKQEISGPGDGPVYVIAAPPVAASAEKWSDEHAPKK